MTIRIGAVWIILNLFAAAFLGADFVVHEIRIRIALRRRHNDDPRVGSIPSIPPRALKS
jgi:hypothetical protein